MEIGFRLNCVNNLMSLDQPFLICFHNIDFSLSMKYVNELYEIKNRCTISKFSKCFSHIGGSCLQFSNYLQESFGCCALNAAYAFVYNSMRPSFLNCHRGVYREREFNSKMSKVFLFFFFCKQLENYKQPSCHVVLYLYYEEEFRRFSQYFFLSLLILKGEFVLNDNNLFHH